jgi:hypothetical protein
MSAAATGVGDISGVHYAQAQTIAHAAATATEDVGYWVAPAAVRVTGLRICPAIAATGDTTNRTNLNFINRTSGAGTTEVANHDYITGTDAAVGTGVALTVTAFNMAANDALAIQAEKVANGLALGATTVQITFAYR